MADTGEDREIKQRVNAHQEEVVREMKKLVQAANLPSVKKHPKSRKSFQNKNTNQSAE